MGEFIIGKGIVVTLGKKNRIIHNGAVYIKDDKIADVGKTEELRLKYKKLKFIDASGKIIKTAPTIRLYKSKNFRNFAPPEGLSTLK